MNDQKTKVLSLSVAARHQDLIDTLKAKLGVGPSEAVRLMLDECGEEGVKRISRAKIRGLMDQRRA